MSVGGAGGGLDLGLGRAGLAAGDVPGDGQVEQHDLLADQRHEPAQVAQGDLSQIDSVEADGARGRVVETEQEIEQGALA